MSTARSRRRRPAESERRRRRKRRRHGGSDLTARVLAAVPAIAFAVFIIVQGGIVFTAGALALGIVCLHELFRMYARLQPVKLAGFLGLAGLALAAYDGDERQVMLALVAFFPVMFLIGIAMPEQERKPLTGGMVITVLGVTWIGLAVAHAILLRNLPHGDAIIVDVLVATFVGDSGAYLGGRMFGRRPLAPSISPNKTLEGLLIGFVCAVIGAWAAGLYQDWLSHGQALLLGVVVGVIAPIGDLFESKIKRDANTKDAGRMFGAHGGALDRLDAAFFTLVAGYYVWLAMM